MTKMKKTKIVYILHECVNEACCEEQEDHYQTFIHGVFSTEKRAHLYRKKHKYARNAEIDAIEFDKL
jgi:hypothetical protein